MRTAVRAIAALLCFSSGCASAPPEPTPAAEQSNALCDVYGFQRGTAAYAECATEVDKATWRAARSRARVNCTPMGEHTVCQ